MKPKLFLPWLCIALITAVTALPLLGEPIQGDDLVLHYYRIPVVNSLWQNGVFFSRWNPDLLFGYGFPLFNFYPPLSAYLLTTLYWVGGADGHSALRLFHLLTLALAPSGMFLASRRLYDDVGGVLSAAAFAWSPYFLLQPYGRASLANALALSLLPWTLWVMLMLLEKRNGRYATFSALFIAAVFLSHVVSSAFFIAPLVVFTAVAALLYKPRQARLLWGAAALALGIGLAAFFWLPAFAEIDATRYAFAASQVDYFASFARVWTWPPQIINGIVGATLPKSVGVAQQVVGIAALLLSGVVLYRGRNRRVDPATLLALLACLIGLGGLFLASAVSAPVWRWLTPLQGLQFPWRLLDVPLFWLPLGVGWLGAWTAQRVNQTAWRIGTALLLTAMLANAVAYLHPPRTTALPKRPSMTDASAVQHNRAVYGLMGWGEYAAADVKSWPPGVPFAGADRFATLAQKLAQPSDSLTVSHSTPWRLQATTNAAAAYVQPLYTHTFPGWQLEIDGEAVPLTILGNGTIALPIPAGKHELMLWFGATRPRRAGNVISLLALLGCAGLVVVGRQGRLKIGDRRSRVEGERAALSTLRFLAVALLVLVVGKLLVVDSFNTPLMLHPKGDTIPDVAEPPQGDFGAAKLVGAQIAPPNRLTLYWQADEPAPRPYSVAVTLRDGRGFPVKELVNQRPGGVEMTRWEVGQLFRDAYTLPVDVVVPPVQYTVDVALADPDSGERLSLLDGVAGQSAVTVGTLKQRPRITQIPNVSPLARFNEAIVLLEVDGVEAAVDGKIDMTLTWGSLNAVPINYTLFVHLLDKNGDIIDQDDAQPTQGVYPTSAWEPGDVIVDRRTWNSTAPPGTYSVQIGLYDLTTGQRLPVSGDGALGDRVVIGTLTIAPQP